MIRNIRRSYFEIWGNEEAQNAFLKGVLVFVLILFAIQSVALTIVALRKSPLIGIGPKETKIFTFTPPSEELLRDELTRLLKQYVEAHYNWDSASVEKAHADAARYVSEKFKKSFMAANSEQVRLAKEKKIAQRVHIVGNIPIDPKALSARVTMDRVLMIEGIRAAQLIVLDISFEYGPRTPSNPEGIYITGEKIVTP